MADFFIWSTIILGIWGAVGPLVGVRYGQELARRWQREHWTNDNAKQECSELLATIANTFSVILKYHAPSASGLPLTGPHDAEEMRARDVAEQNSLEIFYRMLFISDELVKRDIRNRWISAIQQYEKGNDGTRFAGEFGTIAREIRGIATTFIG
jgi:hypothetical protein